MNAPRYSPGQWVFAAACAAVAVTWEHAGAQTTHSAALEADSVAERIDRDLAARVVNGFSGTLERYLAARFFGPLSMASTGTFFPQRLHEQLAIDDTGRVLQPPISDRVRVIAPAFWNLKGNGGMQASAEDMYTWYRAVTRGPRITAVMREALMSAHVRRDSSVAYGYGWFVRTGADGVVEQVSHTGSDGVFYSAFVWRPRDATFYYLVSNSGEQAGGQAAGRVLRLLRTR